MSENNKSQTTPTTHMSKKKESSINRAKPLMDPLQLQTIGLNTDIYAITWTALRNDVWENTEFRGHKVSLTPDNHLWLKLRFLFFFFLVGSTVSILFIEVFTNDLYKNASWSIFILRITLVTWAQRKLQPEFNQGVATLRYAVKNSENFTSVWFAYFVSICQLLIGTFSLICIILFVCMADEAFELIMNFAGLSILSELDDWIGSLIVCSTLSGENDENKNEDFDLKDVNQRMSLNHKLGFLTENFEFIDDQSWVFNDNPFIRGFSYILESIPWTLLPLITIPINHGLMQIH